MIQRKWHGWTTMENAERYERLLRDEVFPGILSRGIPGLRGLEAWRREAGGEVEFVTVMAFDDLTAVAVFTGGGPESSVVPEAARKLLSRYDDHSQHYDLVLHALGARPSEAGGTVGT